MTPVEGLLHTLNDLLHSSMAAEIAKALAPGLDDSPDKVPDAGSYGTVGTSSQPDARSFAGLRLPLAHSGSMDLETIRSFLKDIMAGNPGAFQAELASVLTNSMRQALTSLPGDAALQRGFAEADAAQLLSTPLPPDRMAMPLHQRVMSTASRTELWDGWTGGAPTAVNDQLHPEAARAPEQNTREVAATAAGESGTPGQADDATRRTDAKVAAHASANALAESARGGIIASFVLNAAMIPGWPFQTAPAAANLTMSAAISEEEALAYLANLGAAEEYVERIRKSKPPAGKKLLIYLATLLTAFKTVMDAIAEEFSSHSGDEQALAENRATANAYGRIGDRHRIYLE